MRNTRAVGAGCLVLSAGLVWGCWAQEAEDAPLPPGFVPELVELSGTKTLIAATPVTNAQWRTYLRALPADRRPRPSLEDGWDKNVWAHFQTTFADTAAIASGLFWWRRGDEIPEGWEEHPVALVTRAEAQGFCEWLSSKSDRQFELPSRDLLERAATGYRWVRSMAELDKQASRPLVDRNIVWVPQIPVSSSSGWRTDTGVRFQGTNFAELVTEGLSSVRGRCRLVDDGLRFFTDLGPGASSTLRVVGFRLACPAPGSDE